MSASVEFDPQDPVSSYPSTWQRVVLEPRAFFEGMPSSGGLQPAVLFAAISLTIGGVGFMLFGGGIKGIVLLVMLGIVRLFIGSAIVAFIAQQIFDGRGDYEATFRALAYSNAVMVLIGIPVIKYFAAIYGAYLAIIALGRAHSFDNTRAFLTLLATAVVGTVIVYALGLWGLVSRTNPLFR